ncbi:hypothetical protein RCH16_001467 [Cryobacterium sp. MP_M5]|uniref:DUF3105 domain-containing protein n=1 Tax=unclassified Cryobacterium TaxID=2649013 RepID=UPI0018C91B1A|nr:MULTISPECIES: DUF3105 domain-containing protein [unclassified Cryobacterium]MBG6056794.1 hypothetical protein [Cryobacterium sp. MP_M3]MEC5176465.1 hypothetical protein [Cryobacterium sp. MP_M5]
MPADDTTDAPRSPREIKRLVWNRRFGLALGVLAAVAVSALLISSVLAPASAPGESAGTPGSGATGAAATGAATGTPGATPAATPGAAPIAGLETFANEPSHVTTSVAYPQTPPAGGPHSPVWLDCGVYDRPVPNENAVHSLEHGTVWATYDPALAPAEVAALRAALPGDHVLVSPYPGLGSPIVLTAWNVQLRLDSAADPRIPAFAAYYRNGPTAPEPGESCSGALDAPGKVG